MSLNPFSNRKLLKQGVRGTATVVEINERLLRRQQSDSKDRTNMKLGLRVQVEGGEPYETAGQFWVRPRRLSGIGQELAVAVDSNEQEKVAIDRDRSRPPGPGEVETDFG